MSKQKKFKIENLNIFAPNKRIVTELYYETFSSEEFVGLRSDHNYFDCGAHIGVHLLKLKQKLPNINVTCFEPNPNSFKMLRKNSQGLNKITLVNAAISDKEEVIKLFVDPQDTRGDSITESWGKRDRKIEIPVRTVLLSDYITSKSWIKLDVEGEELKILRDLDRKNKLKDIDGFHIEIHTVNSDLEDKRKQIKKILLENNFNILLDTEKEFRHMIPPYLKDWVKNLNPRIYLITAVKI